MFFGLLSAGLSACSGTSRAAERDQSLKVVATTTIGSPGSPSWNNPRPAASPILIMASNGAGAPPAQRSTSRPPAGAGPASIPDLRAAAERQRVVVVDGTGGVGAWLRSEPAGEPVRVWPDGSPMLLVGADRDAEGRTWRNVLTLDGGSGWMASDYLSPLDPAVVAAALGPASAAAAPPPAEANQAQAAAPATSTPAPPAATPTRTPTGQATRLPAATAAPTATAGPTSTNASQSTPTPTAAATPSATPIRVPSGARSVTVGDLTLSLKSVVRAMAIQVGNRPRP